MSHPASPPEARLVVGDHRVVVTARGSTVLPGGEPPAPVRRLVPPQLPPPGEEPLGREAERAALAAMIRPGDPVQIHGPEGIGKSVLLRRLAHDAAARRPVVHVHGAGRGLDDVLQDLFAAWYDEAGYAPGRVRLRGLLGGIAAVLMIDDLEFPPGGLHSFLRTGPGIALVFTSRVRWCAPDRTFELGGLGEPAALALLSRTLGRPLRQEEVPAATALWETTGGNPLELVRATVGVPYGELGPGERAALAPFAALPSALVAGDVLVRITGVADAARTAVRLARLGLLTEEASPKGVRHRLAPGTGSPMPCEEGVAELAVRTAGWASDADASELAAHAALVTGLVTAVKDDDPGLAVRLARAAAPGLAGSLRWGAWRTLLDAGLAAAEEAGDGEAVTYFTRERKVYALAGDSRGVMAAATPEDPATRAPRGALTRVAAVRTGLVVLGTAVAVAGAIHVVPSLVRLVEERPRTFGCVTVAPGRLVFPRRGSGTVKGLRVTGTCRTAAGGIAAASSDPRFAVVADTCAGHPLLPEQTCLISVRFTPAGVREADAALRITAGEAAGEVALVGEGAPGPVPGKG
ncbi:ATP-binding protein [Streptosporangium saharense]|uniref:ATP-binding protein n=1 Tax=Streptosporangium saharense TaxID=1706840 RepID=UPI003416F9C7